jgi:hypothetical protein
VLLFVHQRKVKAKAGFEPTSLLPIIGATLIWQPHPRTSSLQKMQVAAD